MKTTLNILAILILTLVARDIYACTCIGERSIKDEIKKSDAVFVGTIIDSEEIRIYDTLSQDRIVYSVEMKYTMEIGTVYKGRQIKDTTFIFTGSGGGDCGFNFKKESKYIVYAFAHKVESRYTGQIYIDKKSAFYTTICNRTRLFQTTEIKKIEKHLKKQKIKSDDGSILVTKRRMSTIKGSSRHNSRFAKAGGLLLYQ